MTPRSSGKLDGGLLGEWLLALLVLASFAWVINFFVFNHYLPQPFLFDPSDTFMDWFNTAAFANNPGAYDWWHTVYPPISFVFLRIFSLHGCYIDPFIGRDCDWLGRVTIRGSYALDCLTAYLIFRRRDRATAVPRAATFAIGLPLLFCLERGNLILVCLPLFMYAYSGLARSRFWQGFSIAVTINFKSYLLLASLGLAAKRDWRSLEAAGLLTIAVYLVTLASFGSGTPSQIVENMGVWLRFTTGHFWEQLYFSSSYVSLLAIRDGGFPILDYAPSELVDQLITILPIAIGATQCVALGGIAAAWLKPDVVTIPRATALFVAVHLVTQAIPGYGLTFLIFLIFLEPERRAGPSIALFCAYLLSISYDWILTTVVDADAVSWLSGLTVPANFGLAVGQFVRPGLVMIIVWALAFDTVTQSILAHHRRRPSLGLMPA